MAQTSVLKLYHTVIDDVIAGVRDAFLDEGVDEQVLQEMKQVWTNKLLSSKAVESNPEPLEPQPPPIIANSSKANGTKSKARNNAASNLAAVAAAMNNANSNSQNENSSNMNNSNSMLNGNKQTAQTNQIIQSNSQSIQQQQHHQPQQQNQQQQQLQQQQHSQPPSQPPAAVAGLDPNKIVPIQITLPAQAGVAGSEQPRVLTIQVPASALQENQLHQVLTGPIITSIMPLPPHLASSVLQQHVNSALANQAMAAAANALSIQKQLDGADDTSDEDGSDVSDDNIDGDDDDLDKGDDDKETDNEGGAEEEPLNSEDDVTDEDDAPDLFDSENVVVCQYDKITRSRNKWKFYLKDGIMHINGKDYVFQKSNGDAEW